VSGMQFEDLSPLAVLDRDGLNESFHHGVAVLVDPNGNILESHGNISAPMYPRSALKPVQALAMRKLGLSLPEKEAILSMASHHGTKEHTDLVLAILQGQDLGVEDLQCPSDLPWNAAAKATATSSSLHMNCSGKHAGFLATAKLNGFDTKNYLSIDHPVQVAAKALVEELSGETVTKTTLDGCGAPLFAISTLGLAKAISGFVQLAQEQVAWAMQHPHLIGDVQTPDAAFLRAGLFSKLGAEGVFTVATTSGYALAIKIADGSLRAAPEIAIRLLEKQGLISDSQAAEVRKTTQVESLGGGKVVGGLTASF